MMNYNKHPEDCAPLSGNDNINFRNLLSVKVKTFLKAKKE